MIINIYNEKLINEWDDFVNSTWNGTIYQTRKFINYHSPNKFIDKSIMIYDNNKLICVIPVCKNGDKYFSHLGITYGGPAILEEYFKIDKLKQLIDLIYNYYDNKLEMRIANDIYFNNSQSSLIYLLQTKSNMKLELSWYITKFDINNIDNKFNKRHLKKIKNNKDNIVYISNVQNDYIDFYNILKETLNKKHNTNPTHTLDEFILLKNILKDRHKLCIVKNNNLIIAGMYFIEVTPKKYYSFYITKNYSYELNYSTSCLLYIIDYFIETIKPEILDFGITTENRGSELNMGLSIFKEDSMTGMSNYRYLFLL